MATRTNRTPTRTSTLAVAAVLSVTLLALAGCSAESADRAGAAGPGAVTVENCGIDVGVDGPPERVYVSEQPAIEIAHALGISDRLVSTSTLHGAILPEYEDVQAGLDYTQDLPSREGLLALEPDFVLVGFNHPFAEDGAFGTRASLAELGIQTWILSPLCPTEDGRSDEALDPENVRVETIYEDLRALGRIFEVEDRAEQVIADQQARITAIEEDVSGADRPRVAFVRALEDGTFRIVSGTDFGTRIIEHAGGVNVFDDLDTDRKIVIDAEELIRRDPEVILTDSCCDPTYTRFNRDEDAQAILDHPALAGVSAVENGEVHPFLLADRSAGVRAAHAIEVVAAILHPDRAEPDQAGANEE